MFGACVLHASVLYFPVMCNPSTGLKHDAHMLYACGLTLVPLGGPFRGF